MWDHIINIHPSELLSTKTNESRINELQKKKKKQYKKLRTNKKILKIWTIYIFYLIIFLQEFFEELTKYKNDYISIIFKL